MSAQQPSRQADERWSGGDTTTAAGEWTPHSAAQVRDAGWDFAMPDFAMPDFAMRKKT